MNIELNYYQIHGELLYLDSHKLRIPRPKLGLGVGHGRDT